MRGMGLLMTRTWRSPVISTALITSGTSTCQLQITTVGPSTGHVERDAMKRAAEAVDMLKVNRQAVESPVSECLDQCRLMRLDHYGLRIDGQHIHAHPGAAEVHGPAGRQGGLGGGQYLPSLEQLCRHEPFRIDQELAWCERHKGGVDVHGMRIVDLNDVHSEIGSNGAPNPFNAELVGDVATLDHDVTAEAHEVCGIKYRLEFSNCPGTIYLTRLALIEIVGELRAGGAEPASPAPKIVFNETPIGIGLEVATPPGHRRPHT